MQFRRHSIFGQDKEQPFLPPNKPKPSVGTLIRSTAELVQHVETQMPIRAVLHLVRVVSAEAEVPPEVVRLVQVHFVPPAICPVEDRRALPMPAPTSIPMLVRVLERHKPEQRKAIKAAGYASVAPIRGVKHCVDRSPMSLYCFCHYEGDTRY